MGRKLLCVSLACALALAVFTSSARAAAINYGDLPAATVEFKQVTESSATDPVPLFGAPSVVGDTLVFNPTTFSAFSSGVSPPDVTDGLLTLNIVAKQNQYIDEVTFGEGGGYTLVGAPPGAVSVKTPGFLQILEVAGIGPITPVLVNVVGLFSPNANGTFTLPADATFGSAWTGGFTVDVTQALVNAGYGPNAKATSVRLSFDDILVAQSSAGSTAAIDKKFIELGVTTVIVPEPGTLALLGVGSLIGLALLRRRPA